MSYYKAIKSAGGASGQYSGTGVIKLNGVAKLFGGAIITADGTNAAVVKVYKGTDATGENIFWANSKNSIEILRPFVCQTDTLYYDISGTGATAQLFEYDC